jgi:hypothetical protein
MSRHISLLHISRPEGSADSVGEREDNRREWYELEENGSDTEARNRTETIASVTSYAVHHNGPGLRAQLGETYLV